MANVKKKLENHSFRMNLLRKKAIFGLSGKILGGSFSFVNHFR